jgi:hypothetical protein
MKHGSKNSWKEDHLATSDEEELEKDRTLRSSGISNRENKKPTISPLFLKN